MGVVATIALGAIGLWARFNIAIGPVGSAPCAALADRDCVILGSVSRLPIRLIHLGTDRAAHDAADRGPRNGGGHPPRSMAKLIADDAAGNGAKDGTRALGRSRLGTACQADPTGNERYNGNFLHL